MLQECEEHADRVTEQVHQSTALSDYQSTNDADEVRLSSSHCLHNGLR